MTNDTLIKGIIAGAIGGIAATAVKTWWESRHPVRSEYTETPPVILAEKVKAAVVQVPLKEANKALIGDSIHWIFGISTGAIYGGFADTNPAITTGWGIPFGVGFWLLTHGSTIPMMNLEPYPVNVRMDYAWNEFAGHLLYGLTLDIVRRSTLTLIGELDN